MTHKEKREFDIKLYYETVKKSTINDKYTTNPLKPFTIPEFQFLMRVKTLRLKKVNEIRVMNKEKKIKRIRSNKVIALQIIELHHTNKQKMRRWKLAIILFKNVKEYTPPGIFPQFFEPIRHSLLRKLVHLINQYSFYWRASERKYRYHKYLKDSGLGEYFRKCRKAGLKIQI